jgi:3-deoxy-D-manno-octulosonate 8-phosphate phosphatase (KDO 8-P phosphatase)
VANKKVFLAEDNSLKTRNHRVLDLAVLCLDVDGVMTDGTFLYSVEGKSHKRFGPEDGDALKILRRYVEIRFVTADHRGLGISRARIERDLGFALDLVPSAERLTWLTQRYSLERVAYMGDSFLDIEILRQVAVAISPANASPHAQSVSDFVTDSAGGAGAVAEACFYIAGRMAVEPPEFNF